MPPVFRRAHDDDHVGRARFFARALAPDTHREGTQIPENKHHQSQDRKEGRALEVRYSYLNIVRRAGFSKVVMSKIESITSAANPLIKDVRRAILRGGLTDDGWCVAESYHLLEEALRSGREVPVVLMSESARITGNGHRTVILPDKLFQSIAATETSQGVIALVEPPTWSIDQLFGPQSLVVVLDGLQDPGNAGAIARTAEAFGATGVMFLKGTVSPHHPKTLRASAGSLFRIPFATGTIASDLDRPGLSLYAAMPFTGSQRLAGDVDFKRPCAIVIGSEGRGVSLEVHALCEEIAIPTMAVESLNAAAAAAILLYEARRQRQ